eukprot:Skav221220  [mRNA]  locus=scaffold2467:242780:249741:- [translate_table: standard]
MLRVRGSLEGALREVTNGGEIMGCDWQFWGSLKKQDIQSSAMKQTSLIASKTEEQLAVADKQSQSTPRKPQETGTVNSWNVQRQFGFASCDNSRQDVFVHAEAFKDMEVRDRVKKTGLQREGPRNKDTGRGKKPEEPSGMFVVNTANEHRVHQRTSEYQRSVLHLLHKAKNVELDETGRSRERGGEGGLTADEGVDEADAMEECTG